MPKVIAQKSSMDPGQSLSISLSISGQGSFDVFPSALIDSDDESETAAEVIEALETEYEISSVGGALRFLYNQDWLGQMNPTITIEVEDI